MPPVNGKRYFTFAAVVFNEVMKLTMSGPVALYE
jgi:hypothetical protein